jgi:hypothetical protein
MYCVVGEREVLGVGYVDREKNQKCRAPWRVRRTKQTNIAIDQTTNNKSRRAERINDAIICLM